jgi:hypothetical protein
MNNLSDFQDDNIPYILNKFKGQEVTLLIDTGALFTGQLDSAKDFTSVLTKTVRLEKIVGNDYSDLFIAKASVIGVVLRRPDSP